MLVSRLYKYQGTRSSYSSSAETHRDQHSSSHTVRHWRKVLGLPTDTACYVHRLRQALGRGSCTTGIPSTVRPTQKAKIAVGSLQLLCPLFLFLEKDKGCTILSLATTNKHGLFLKGGNLSVLIFLTGFFFSMFSHAYIFPPLYRYCSWDAATSQGQGGSKGRKIWGVEYENRIWGLP